MMSALVVNINNSLVSVIIPVFNRECFIEECLDSIRGQSYRPIEIVVVDDGSVDRSVNLIEVWANRWEEAEKLSVHLIRQENTGANVARNAAITHAMGGYIQFLDSDDVLLPDKLKDEVDFLQAHTDIDFVYNLVEFADEKLSGLERYVGMDYSNSPDRVLQLMWHTCGPLYRRHVVDGVGAWNEGLANNQDLEYACRVKLQGYEGRLMPKVGALARLHDEGNIGVKGFSEKYSENHFRAIESILFEARKHNKLSQGLLHHCHRRLIYLGVDFSRHGCSENAENITRFLKEFSCPPSLRHNVVILLIKSRLLSKIVFHLFRCGIEIKQKLGRKPVHA